MLSDTCGTCQFQLTVANMSVSRRTQSNQEFDQRNARLDAVIGLLIAKLDKLINPDVLFDYDPSQPFVR